MDAAWTWLAVAGAGALHGLSPATGWPLAACRAVRAGGGAPTWRALLPMAFGHAASISVVAGAAVVGVAMSRHALIAGAAIALAAVVAILVAGRPARGLAAPAADAGLALWSFAMATAHGAGLMLVPALMPLCLGSGASEATFGAGPLAAAIGLVAVHMAAMLGATGALAAGAKRWAGTAARRRRGGSGAGVGDAVAVAGAARALEMQLDVGLARADRGDRFLDLLGRGVELLGPASLLFGRGRGGAAGG